MIGKPNIHATWDNIFSIIEHHKSTSKNDFPLLSPDQEIVQPSLSAGSIATVSPLSTSSVSIPNIKKKVSSIAGATILAASGLLGFASHSNIGLLSAAREAPVVLPVVTKISDTVKTGKITTPTTSKASIVNLSATEATKNAPSVRYENRLIGTPEQINNLGAKGILDLFQTSGNYQNNLGIHLMSPKGIDSQVIKDLADQTSQQVRYYDDDQLQVWFNPQGEGGVFKYSEKDKKNHRVNSTIYTSDKYKPLTQRPLTTTTQTPWMEHVEKLVNQVSESGMASLEEGTNNSLEISDMLKTVHLKSGNEWCGATIGYGFSRAGITPHKSGAISLAWRGFGTKLDRPAIGAIATYPHGKGKGHAGFVKGFVKGSTSKLVLVGGNQLDTVNYMVKDIADLKFNYPSGYKPEYNLPSYSVPNDTNTFMFTDLPTEEQGGR
jgi:uncharacterized protein (TIGR02594 family)